MSKHILTTKLADKTIQLTLGWDRALKQYFYNLQDLSLSPPENIIGSSLTMSNEDLYDVDVIVEVLEDLGVAVPRAMIDEVLADEVNLGGNRVVHYSPELQPGDGSKMEISDQALNELIAKKGYCLFWRGQRTGENYFYELHTLVPGEDGVLESGSVVLLSYDIGDVCRFLGLDGITAHEGMRARRGLELGVPTVRYFTDPATGVVQTVIGPVELQS